MKFSINGKEFEFDVFDLDQVAQLEESITTMAKDEKEAIALLKSSKLKEGVKALYSAYQKFFIDLTGQDIVAGCNNALKAQAFLVDFVKEIKQNSASDMKERIKLAIDN